MSNNNLQLSKWGDGTIQLAFWNWNTGQDIFFVLKEDGQAERREIDKDSKEIITPIPNLVIALRGFTDEIPELLKEEED